MKKYLLYSVLFLSVVALAGCGTTATSSSSTTDTTTISYALNTDPSLFDVGSSDTTFDTSGNGKAIGIMSTTSQEPRAYSWYRVFGDPTGITITDVSVEAASAEVVVTRSVNGTIYTKAASSSTASTENFSQNFTRYVKLTNSSNMWHLSQITQGICMSTANTSGSFNSVSSDVTIDSVSIYDTTAGITFAVTPAPSASGPWIDYSNIATTEVSHNLVISVVAEQIANIHGPVPFLFVWPDLSGTGNFFRHQLTYSSGSVPFSYSYSFTVPADEPTGRKRLTIGAFTAGTLASDEAMQAYDFTSWHIPYKVE